MHVNWYVVRAKIATQIETIENEEEKKNMFFPVQRNR